MPAEREQLPLTERLFGGFTAASVFYTGSWRAVSAVVLGTTRSVLTQITTVAGQGLAVD